MSWKPTRDQAYELLCEYTKSESLRRHALAVEGVMRHFAALLGADNEEDWAVVGLLHDLDYEQHPDEHCQKTEQILREKDLDPGLLRAILSHGYGICTDVKPQTDMEKVLYTIDELTGLVVAAALMRPTKSVLDMKLKSLKKKFKTPSFAAGVDRDLVRQGSEWLGWELDDVLLQTIEGMRKIADRIGLAGSA